MIRFTGKYCGAPFLCELDEMGRPKEAYSACACSGFEEFDHYRCVRFNRKLRMAGSKGFLRCKPCITEGKDMNEIETCLQRAREIPACSSEAIDWFAAVLKGDLLEGFDGHWLYWANKNNCLPSQFESIYNEYTTEIEPIEGKYAAECKSLADRYWAEIKSLEDRYLADIQSFEDRYRAELKPLADKYGKIIFNIIQFIKDS